MAETKSPNENPIQPNYMDRRSKRWAIAQTRTTHMAQRTQNSCVEFAYHEVIKAVKTLYMQPSEIYYERDHKLDKSQGLFGVHCFITPTFYWWLECDLCYDFQVEYAFNNCSFEGEIRKMLRPYPLDRQAKKIYLQPDFNTFYQTVLAIQDKQYFHSLQG